MTRVSRPDSVPTAVRARCFISAAPKPLLPSPHPPPPFPSRRHVVPSHRRQAYRRHSAPREAADVREGRGRSSRGPRPGLREAHDVSGPCPPPAQAVLLTTSLCQAQGRPQALAHPRSSLWCERFSFARLSTGLTTDPSVRAAISLIGPSTSRRLPDHDPSLTALQIAPTSHLQGRLECSRPSGWASASGQPLPSCPHLSLD